MKLKFTLDPKPRHSDVATGVSWSSSDTIYSSGDDHLILAWNLGKNETVRITELGSEVYPTGIWWPPKANTGGQGGGGGRKGGDLLLITAADGYFHLLGRGGRIEKSVQGHKGAILSGSWSSDGSEICTAGEDGCVKVWSRIGMLRTTLNQCAEPVYSAVWSPDGTAIVHTSGQSIVMKPTQAGGMGSSRKQAVRWKAHDGVILCLASSSTSGLIVSGGEDCRYKVWDPTGKPIYSSGQHIHPITSIGWAPAGDLFAVGSFNTIRLCDRYGWSHFLDKPKVGSVYNISWSADGTQLAGAGATGHVFLASVIERKVSWKTYEATLASRRTVTVAEFTNNTEDRLDFRDRVVKMSFDHGYLICITVTQLYLYNVSNVNTPTICELREHNAVSLILQSPSHFVLCGGVTVSVWGYDGRQMSTIRWPGMKLEFLSRDAATMSGETIAFIDQTDGRIIRMFDPPSGKQEQEIRVKHAAKIIALSREEYPGATDRTLAILDKNNDLSVMIVRKYGAPSERKLLATMISTIMWHREAPMLACIKDGMLRIYYYPQILYIDTTLLDFTWEDRETISDLGRSPEILLFDSNRISIRKADGVLVVGTASAFMAHLHKHCNSGKFVEAKRICSYVNSKYAWGVTAGLAALKQDLGVAEKCYSELGMYDKVLFIQDIKANSQDEPTRRSLLSILSGNMGDAENTLLQNGRFQHAIELNMTCCNWERALELALKNNMLIETVLKARKEYLIDMKQNKEKIQLFIDAEKKFGSTFASSTKKKAKAGGTKKREKSAPTVGPDPTLDDSVGYSGAEFSLQSSSLNQLSGNGMLEKEPGSLGGINETEEPDMKYDDGSSPLNFSNQMFPQTQRKNESSAGVNSGARGRTFEEAEKELEVDDFY